MYLEQITAPKLTEAEIKAIEGILHRRNQAEIKMEKGCIVVVEIHRMRVI